MHKRADRIQHWFLPTEETQYTTTNLVHARCKPDTHLPGPTSFDQNRCSILIEEIGVCRDLGCDDKIVEKTAKYYPLIAALKNYLGKVDFIDIPIGLAGTTIVTT
jgi:hypothetical protein